MLKHWKYLKYVVRHKWYVFQECAKYGLIWRGIIHDWTKLLPIEWIPYAEHFYGSSNKLNEEYKYNVAWLHHQKMNKHHWQWWVLLRDSGHIEALEMPDKYRKEMVADWRGAGKAISGKDDVQDWYMANKDKMTLHPYTRTWVELEIGVYTGGSTDVQ